MKAQGRPTRTLWLAADGWSLEVIDQRQLPHHFAVARLASLGEVVSAIREMVVRGAPLIGATAAYGVCLALRADPGTAALEAALAALAATRPTAVNLKWALAAMGKALLLLPPSERVAKAYARAAALCDAEEAACRAIGESGVGLLATRAAQRSGPVQVLTHCNAGWLGCVDYGTALAPIYLAHSRGIPVHVWVDETRPRNQGASLTAWELREEGIPHTVIADNAGGHLMQHGEVDLCLVGADRVTRRGDVCNKIGTYLKALAARDNGVPFYAAVPASTIDWTLEDGVREIPIEERDATEVTHITGALPSGALATVQLTPTGSPASNYGFDVTPARLLTGLITERGVSPASAEGLASAWPAHER